MFLLKEASYNDFNDFSSVWEFIQKAGVSSITFVGNKEIQIIEPAPKGLWAVRISSSSDVLTFIKNNVQVSIARRNTKRVYTEGGYIIFAMKTGSIFKAFYDD
jgi:hypothetical protein